MSEEVQNENNSQNEDPEQEEGLTKEEEAKCWEAFSAFDKDSSGYIDANELRIVLEMMGQKTTEEEISFCADTVAIPDPHRLSKILWSLFSKSKV